MSRSIFTTSHDQEPSPTPPIPPSHGGGPRKTRPRDGERTPRCGSQR